MIIVEHKIVRQLMSRVLLLLLLLYELKVKSKAVPLRHSGAKGERMYSSSFLTSTLDEGEWLASHPGHALSPGKDPPYPLRRRLGGH
jgi:hypothetical protein